MTSITDWRALLTGSHRALSDAVAGVPSGAWDSATPCEQWNATQVLQHALDAAVHAWDIAVATGRPSPLTPEIAADLLVVARRIVEPLRGFAYAPAIDAGGGPEAELLAYLGRRPDWSVPRA